MLMTASSVLDRIHSVLFTYHKSHLAQQHLDPKLQPWSTEGGGAGAGGHVREGSL
jgi:hypothetical protein